MEEALRGTGHYPGRTMRWRKKSARQSGSSGFGNPSGFSILVSRMPGLVHLRVFLVFSLFSFTLHASEPDQSADVLFFYEAGCPHCARVEGFLNDRIDPSYPVEIRKYEVHKPENARLLGRFARLYQTEVFTPSVVVGDTLIKGDERTALRSIEAATRQALRNNLPPPLSLLRKEESFRQNISLSAVLSAAAVDAINPCAAAVLTLLLGTILVSRRTRGQIIKAGLAFTAATWISYMLMGLGLFYVINIAGIQPYLYIGISVLAILIGLGNMKDYLWPQRWFTMEVPQSWRPQIRQITSRVTSVPGAFGVGFLVSVFLLPCTSGPYVVVIGMISDSPGVYAFALLLLYNLIFILPFIGITLGVGYGLTTPARIEKMRKEKLKKIHLITGSIMLAIGIALMLLVVTGNM